MSVDIMSAVFKRYPVGGGEMLLALALADHAHDDGTNVFPKIAALAVKTRQSERSVQYQLRRMEESGWLIRVSPGNGGRSMSTEYRISPAWIAGGTALAPNPAPASGPENGANGNGAEIAPIEKGAIHDDKGCNPRQKRVQRVAPANNRHKPSINHQGDARACELAKPDDVVAQTWADFLAVRKAAKAPLTPTALDGIRREAAKAGISLEDALKTCCEAGWRGFKADWLVNRNRRSSGVAPSANKYAGAHAAVFGGGMLDD